jgi:hypothetical protein
MAEKDSIFLRTWRLLIWPPAVPEGDFPEDVQASIQQRLNHRMLLSSRSWLAFVVCLGVIGTWCIAVWLCSAMWLPGFHDSNLFAWLISIPALPLGLIVYGVIAKPAFLKYRREVWRSHGLCPECGYDLRGTPCRCPERGAVRECGQ